MRGALLALVLILCSPQDAAAVELRRLAIEYNNFLPSSHFAEMPERLVKEGLDLNFEIGLVGPLRWQNRIHALTDPGRYRWIGWNFYLHLDIFQSLSAHYRHHSQHLLDAAFADRFPVEDSWGVTWTIWDSGAPRRPIF